VREGPWGAVHAVTAPGPRVTGIAATGERSHPAASTFTVPQRAFPPPLGEMPIRGDPEQSVEQETHDWTHHILRRVAAELELRRRKDPTRFGRP
jgi:hypothetical protein